MDFRKQQRHNALLSIGLPVLPNDWYWEVVESGKKTTSEFSSPPARLYSNITLSLVAHNGQITSLTNMRMDFGNDKALTNMLRHMSTEVLKMHFTPDYGLTFSGMFHT